MTTQAPLALIPTGATEISAAAAMIEDEHGGRVFVHGHLSFAWDATDTAGRRFAAVSLIRIKAATQTQVAAAFATSPLTVWRWGQALSAAGVGALVPHRTGPRRASKLTPEVNATIVVLREQGLSLRAIGERVAVSEATVRRALSEDPPTETETEIDDPIAVSDEVQADTEYPATGSDADAETGTGMQPEPVGRPEPVAEPVLEATPGLGQLPVLADPVAAAPSGLGGVRDDPVRAAGVHRCGRAPLAGCSWRYPRWPRPGCSSARTTVYGGVPERVLLAGHDVVRERVPRPAR